MSAQKACFGELVNAARDFCLLIENVEHYDSNQLLADIARILPRLQSAMNRLDDLDLEYSYFSLPDLEERFEMYCRLKDQLGEYDPYMLEFDISDDLEEMTGSLASDFADMYFELNRGLQLYDSALENRQDAGTMWQTGYILLWGRQLVNAQKHLFSLNFDQHM